MKENIISTVLSAVVAGVSAYFKVISIPLIVLLTVMLIDYLTGMAAAFFKAELSSKKGIKGIIKKIGYLALVCVGIGVDFIIRFCFEQIGIPLEIGMLFGLIITVWLIINELLSILENVGRIGVPVPKTLSKIINKLKLAVERKADNNTK
ncbi:MULTISPECIES: phage holin family protein [unclassified Ruminococcus]|uniref:phage holin family protein n=1 Tax=unclassified Ruminococcus TaxID=2608920 RepID=UPI00210F18B6